MDETNTLSFAEGDVYIWISASGTTGRILLNAQKAQKRNVIILGITSKNMLPLQTLTEGSILVKATTRGEHGEEQTSIQLLGSLFDQSVHLLAD